MATDLDAQIRLDFDNELEDAFFATREEALAAVAFATARSAKETPPPGLAKPMHKDAPF